MFTALKSVFLELKLFSSATVVSLRNVFRGSEAARSLQFQNGMHSQKCVRGDAVWGRERRSDADEGDSLPDGVCLGGGISLAVDGQIRASVENFDTEGNHAGRNGDAGQSGTVDESAVVNEGDAVGDGDAGQTGAAVKHAQTDRRGAIQKDGAGKGGAVFKRKRCLDKAPLDADTLETGTV